MTLLRLKELSNNRLTDAQLLAIKEEVKAECVRALQSLINTYSDDDDWLLEFHYPEMKPHKEV